MNYRDKGIPVEPYRKEFNIDVSPLAEADFAAIARSYLAAACAPFWPGGYIKSQETLRYYQQEIQPKVPTIQDFVNYIQNELDHKGTIDLQKILTQAAEFAKMVSESGNAKAALIDSSNLKDTVEGMFEEGKPS